jgi:hypothetical protein
MQNRDRVWVFCGDNCRLPGAVFENLDEAERWIKDNNVSGILTAYPLNTSVFDWAVDKGFFQPRKPEHKTPEFIQKFSSAYLGHFHFERGVRMAGIDPEEQTE